MLNFAPQSEQELLNLIPDGEYNYLVKDAVHHRSKSSGNESIKMTLTVYDQHGREHTIYCYLTTNYMFLLKHFTDSCGLESAYENGSLSPEMCKNQVGRCKVIIEQPEEGTNYLPKNIIKDFCKRQMSEPPKSELNSIDDKDIPF